MSSTFSTSSTNNRPPELIARGVLVESGRLLVCRNLAKGYAYLPGGHIEPGETAAAALARELREECGLTIRVGTCALVTELVADGLHELNLVFHVERERDDDTTSTEQIESLEPEIGFEWLDLAAIVDEDLRPNAIKAWVVSGGTSDGEHAAFVSEA